MIELSDLRIFKAVVDEGGILSAARKLYRVPSNVTARIQKLEADAKVELFYRRKQRLHLSPSGVVLMDYAQRMLRLSEEASQALASSTPVGLLRIGALESTTASRLPKILAKFHKKFPQVRIELSTGTNDALTAAVLDRRIDAAFIAEAPDSEDIDNLPLFAERLVLISDLGHRPIRYPKDVSQDSVIAFPNGCAYRRRLYGWLGVTSSATVRALDLSSYHAIVVCVGAGTGVALMPESVLEALPMAQVQRHALPKKVSELVTPLIWRTGEKSSALVALIDQLEALPRIT